jgi:tRNA(Ile)-lysidine synthase
VSVGPAESPQAAVAKFLDALRRPARILVAVSGGSDSTGLLALLADGLEAKSDPEITLCAVTIDHGLRPEAAIEARDVAALCARLGVPHAIRRWEGEKPKTGLMAAAREARYGLLSDAAVDLGATVVVTGHTVDDQMETLAMRDARRGEREPGPATGIADAVLFDRRIWVLRPLLASRRADIRAYLAGRGIPWIDDPSNDDLHYERVRIRKRLAAKEEPVLGIDLDARRAAISRAAADWLGAHVLIHANALAEILPSGLKADGAVLAYALAKLTAVIGGRPFGIGRDRLRGILAFIGEGHPGRRTAGGVVFDVRKNGLYLMRESRGLAPVTVASGESRVWDGRFEIVNHGSAPVRVEATGIDRNGLFAETLPKAAVQRATAALPHVTLSDGQTAPDPAFNVEIQPYFAPFDRFLTRFDLNFADRLAEAFRRKPYRPLPLGGN